MAPWRSSLSCFNRRGRRGSLPSVAPGRRPRGKPQGVSLHRVYSGAFPCIVGMVHFIASCLLHSRLRAGGGGRPESALGSGALPSCPPCILMAEMEAKIKTSDLYLLPGDPLSQEAHRPLGGHFPSLQPPAPVGTTRPVSQEEGPPPGPSGRTWPLGPGWPLGSEGRGRGPFRGLVAWRITPRSCLLHVFLKKKKEKQVVGLRGPGRR